jgi:hypothetical protein
VIVRQSKRTSTSAIPDIADNTLNTVHKTPAGYPKLGAFLDSDENFMVYRRFGYLQARLLLEKQDELQKLERQLDREDKIAYREDNDLLRTRQNYDQERMKGRGELLEKIEKIWIKYCK